MTLDPEARRRRIEQIEAMANDVAIAIIAAEATFTAIPTMAPSVLIALSDTAAKLRSNQPNELRSRDRQSSTPSHGST